MRAAIYARYSSDLQSETSIDDPCSDDTFRNPYGGIGHPRGGGIDKGIDAENTQLNPQDSEEEIGFPWDGGLVIHGPYHRVI